MMRRHAVFSSTLLCKSYFAPDPLEKDIAGLKNRLVVNNLYKYAFEKEKAVLLAVLIHVV